MKRFRANLTPSFLCSNILINTLSSHVLNLRSSLRMRGRGSHPSKTRDKFIILFILLFTFLDSKREDRRLWSECYKALPEFNLLLISSWMQFWSVAVGPKCLNSATFSNYLLAAFTQSVPKRCIHKVNIPYYNVYTSCRDTLYNNSVLQSGDETWTCHQFSPRLLLHEPPY
jgi:hypothetical protein